MRRLLCCLLLTACALAALPVVCVSPATPPFAPFVRERPCTPPDEPKMFTPFGSF